MSIIRFLWILCASLVVFTATPVTAAPEGTLTFALHYTLPPRWLDPAESESIITPYLTLYALHDALLKTMPGGAAATPSLAESWSMAKDGLSAEFTLRASARFHNGEPVTADDVKFSFERYRGGAAKLLKDTVVTGASRPPSSASCSRCCPTRPRARRRSSGARSTSRSC